jgi:hypothetical protein
MRSKKGVGRLEKDKTACNRRNGQIKSEKGYYSVEMKWGGNNFIQL